MGIDGFVVMGTFLAVVALAVFALLKLQKRSEQRQREIAEEDRELKARITKSYPSVKISSSGKKTSVVVSDGARVSGLKVNGKTLGTVQAKPGETLRYEDDGDGLMVQTLLTQAVLSEEPRRNVDVIESVRETTYHQDSYHQDSYSGSSSSSDCGSSYDSGGSDCGGGGGGD